MLIYNLKIRIQLEKIHFTQLNRKKLTGQRRLYYCLLKVGPRMLVYYLDVV